MWTAVMTVLVAALVFPLYWAVVSSFTPDERLFGEPDLIPRAFVLTHYRVLFEERAFWVPVRNSLIVAGATGSLMVWGFQNEFRRIVGRIHENLALGSLGTWIVIVATAGALVLQLGGVFLWWKRKTLRVRTGAGWRAAVNDLHHAVGLLGLLLMLLIAATGVGMRMVGPGPMRRTIVDFHTSRRFPLAIDIVCARAKRPRGIAPHPPPPTRVATVPPRWPSWGARPARSLCSTVGQEKPLGLSPLSASASRVNSKVEMWAPTCGANREWREGPDVNTRALAGQPLEMTER